MDLTNPPDIAPAPAGSSDSGPAENRLFETPFTIEQPRRQKVPFVFCSPHSGRSYPESFLRAANLDPLTLRRSEDSFVEEIFAGVTKLGAPLIHAHFPRSYIDANREPYELDPAMFADPLPPHVNTRSSRVAGGLGTIARVVAESLEIYRHPLPYAEAERRIRQLYMPFHTALRELLEQTLQSFGCAILIDCHSMPSVGGPFDEDTGTERPGIVLGDRYGTSCSRGITDAAEGILLRMGYAVARNLPYAGGFNTEHYGRPQRHLHALQIEINRAFYMNEARQERNPGMEKLKQDMMSFCAELSAIDWVATLAPKEDADR